MISFLTVFFGTVFSAAKLFFVAHISLHSSFSTILHFERLHDGPKKLHFPLPRKVGARLLMNIFRR